ncbi:MAG TPA: selenocysteine-specific translation elongation factor [Myxococcota bacterium]|nr:selenocysteine-specific translation elongation factor [Myxococcota bacterium]
MELPTAFVVGTAGHIDHGKTSLVRALTGVDLDALPEEKRRGITIALGFTPLSLPSGRVASFVDVPGHERLVRTMIAGATGIDAVLLCVSAVEGVMPQTREHLDILRLLEVEVGAIALTMADLVDDEMVELAIEDVRELVEGSFLDGAPVVVTSAEQRRGVDALIEVLDGLPCEERDQRGPFRLPVDRTFVQRGFGAIVTGTALSGSVSDGDELVVLPQGDKVRVRGVQVHGQKCGGSRAGLRTALNLAGAAREELPRGTVVASKGVPVTSMLDARVQLLPTAPRLDSGSRVRLLVGTAEVLAVAHVLDGDLDPGSCRLVQLRTGEPVVCLPGDRFVLRRESPMTTLGGGVVLDPWAPKLRPRDHARGVDELTRLEGGDRGVLLERAGLAGLAAEEARRRGVEGDALAGVVLSPTAVARLRGALIEDLQRFHAEHPLSPGAPRRALHRGSLAALGPASFDALLSTIDEVVAEGPRLRLEGFSVALTPEQSRCRERLLDRVIVARWEGSKRDDLLSEIEEGAALLALLMDEDEVQLVAGRLYAKGALDDLIAAVEALLEAEGELSPGRFKALTGLARKGAIPLLEWLDTRRVTRREGDVRVRW